MKILLVSEDLPAPMVGGLGKHVITLGNALIAAGHEVSLMGSDTPDYAACASEMGFHGKFIPGFVKPIQGWKERQLGFFNPWKRPYFARRLAKAIQMHAQAFDVVHYHGHLPLVGNYIPESVNFVQTRHDQGGDCITDVRFKNGDVCKEHAASACATCIHFTPNALRTSLSAIAVKKYRNETARAYARHPVVFVSEFLRSNFSATLPAANMPRSYVMHNFIDEDALQDIARNTSATVDSAVVRVHITGRIDEPKGIAAFLDLLVPQMPTHWRVDVYGDGPLRKASEAKHAGRAVTFHGHTGYPETIAATSRATVVVVPSVWEEAFGTVTLEALRLGKSCYALNRGGTTELGRYGAEGQLRLFAGLPDLVNALLVAKEFPCRVGGEPSDVRTFIPKLLKLYAGGVV